MVNGPSEELAGLEALLLMEEGEVSRAIADGLEVLGASVRRDDWDGAAGAESASLLVFAFPESGSVDLVERLEEAERRIDDSSTASLARVVYLCPMSPRRNVAPAVRAATEAQALRLASRSATVNRIEYLAGATEAVAIAKAVAFLASPRAGYMTGVGLPLDGGSRLGLYPEMLEGSAGPGS